MMTLRQVKEACSRVTKLYVPALQGYRGPSREDKKTSKKQTLTLDNYHSVRKEIEIGVKLQP